MKLSRWISAIVVVLSLALLVGALFCLTSCGEEFKIKDGVLKSYNGENKVVVIPSEVTEISESAFMYCDFVTEIVFPPSLSTISPAALRYCPNATWTVSENHPTYYIDNGNLMRRADKRLIMANKDGTAPSYAEGIETGAYRNIPKSGTVTLPAGLTFLSKAVFEDCEFTRLNIAGNIETIEANAFSEAKIKQIYVTSVPTIEANTFADMKADIVSLDGNVTCVKGNAFYDSDIDEIVIGASVAQVHRGAINKVKLKTVTVPFLGARSGADGEEMRTDAQLSEIFGSEGSEMSYNVSTIKTKIHNSLEKVTVISGTVCKDAFSGCPNVETIVLKEGVYGEIGAGAFSDTDSTLTLYVGTGVTGFGQGCFWRVWITDSVLIKYAGSEVQWNQVSKYSAEGKDDWTGKSNVTVHYSVPTP